MTTAKHSAVAGLIDALLLRFRRLQLGENLRDLDVARAVGRWSLATGVSGRGPSKNHP